MKETNTLLLDTRTYTNIQLDERSASAKLEMLEMLGVPDLRSDGSE